jgi:glycosidase
MLSAETRGLMPGPMNEGRWERMAETQVQESGGPPKGVGWNLSGEACYPFGFPLSRKVWRLHRVGELLGPADAPGGVDAARRFVDRVNAALPGGAPPLSTAHLLMAALLEDILRHLVNLYCWEQNPGSLLSGMDSASAQRGRDVVDLPSRTFLELFPPTAVQMKRVPAKDYLAGGDPGRPNRERVVRELVLLNLAVANTALKPLHPLFDDTDLKRRAPYEALVNCLDAFFETQPPVKALGESLFKCLRAPMLAAPDSLDGQLQYIRERWAPLLPEQFMAQLLLVRGILTEETTFRGFGPGPVEVLRFGAGQAGRDEYPEVERFSADWDWMSNVVLIAKTIYVWLDQLSRRHGRLIRRLDQIPDETLDELAAWGFTGLWLIGVWRRSNASRQIKQNAGNSEALASAYSIEDYVIAEDLGGEPAYCNLRDRAAQRGIRLASDMVPNHMGIDSRWVMDHPDWFLQTDHPPYPGYGFTGPDLSQNNRFRLQIEDGYWERRDAAVVFRLEDTWSGQVRHIYHGNDGTNMPWNDTAQLNYLLPEVREAVIQAILHVARMFPVIRFDAAMTLSKRHYQRLWFPKPGEGGAIPSRAEHGMDRDEFDQHLPGEFWREVVDRVAAEAPGTLLLAEAFWLMEGYFVRTLGMHRVYNSAFMNMLKMEENLNYRTTVRNVLEFSPEILKRFVNFMNNPDEQTAVEQFGKGDKYFGVAVLMVTMPGLPMFGHGQIEGFSEKYGMEYPRAYWDEAVDEDMVHRHETEIFPLMRRRSLFSEVENFAFYDFVRHDGQVDENVFAYSNRNGDDRAVIVYNNAYATTEGRLRVSTAVNVGTEEDRRLVRRTLAESLGLRAQEGLFYVFRDHNGGLEYIRTGRQLAEGGMAIHLNAYQYHAFLDFREIRDTDGSYARLAAELNGSGVPDMDQARKTAVLGPLLDAFQELLDEDRLRLLTDPLADADDLEKTRTELDEAVRAFIAKAGDHTGTAVDPEPVVSAMHGALDLGRELLKEAGAPPSMKPEIQRYLSAPANLPPEEYLRVPVVWALVHPLGQVLSKGLGQTKWVSDWLLTDGIAGAFTGLGREQWLAELDARLLELVTRHAPAFGTGAVGKLKAFARRLLHDPAVRDYLFANKHEGILWINKEQMESLVYWLFFTSMVSEALASETGKKRDSVAAARYRWAQALLKAAQAAHYELDKMLDALSLA